jgi:hypothetical protein
MLRHLPTRRPRPIPHILRRILILLLKVVRRNTITIWMLLYSSGSWVEKVVGDTLKRSISRLPISLLNFVIQ